MLAIKCRDRNSVTVLSDEIYLRGEKAKETAKLRVVRRAQLWGAYGIQVAPPIQEHPPTAVGFTARSPVQCVLSP